MRLLFHQRCFHISMYSYTVFVSQNICIKSYKQMFEPLVWEPLAGNGSELYQHKPMFARKYQAPQSFCEASISANAKDMDMQLANCSTSVVECQPLTSGLELSVDWNKLLNIALGSCSPITILETSCDPALVPFATVDWNVCFVALTRTSGPSRSRYSKQ